ncbi:MAG: pyruvate kinase [Candidatus Thorarchaeota archaeon]
MTHEKSRSKIVCTIGPASKSEDVLRGMVNAGMDVARINLSHESHPSAKKTFDMIRKVDDTVAILFDLQGPKIRIGEMKEPVMLVAGEEFVLSIDDFIGDITRASISHKELPKDVKPGNILAINDGIVRLRIDNVEDSEIKTTVVSGGEISSRKGVNVPGIRLSCHLPTEKDLKDLDLAAELEPDFIALSFVLDADDIRRVNEITEANGPKKVDLVSKIEHTLAVENYDEILRESHGVMIARGDLGIEVPIEDVPVLQRELIRKANVWARPAIVATHMLESMTHDSVPTRAEVSDVAHAVFDRADAVMLSGETAMGHDPIGAVSMMSKIARRAEKKITPVNPLDITSPKRLIVEVVGNLVYNAVALLPEIIDGIITATRSGFTARWLSKFRPPTDIYAVANEPAVMRRLRLLWGVHPVRYEHDINNVDDLVRESVRAVHSQGYIASDKDVVFTSGIRHIPRRTNIMGIFHVNDLLLNV